MVASMSGSMISAPSDLLAYVDSERRRADVVGIAVAAFDRDGMRFVDGLGHADLRRAERVTPATRFRAASISKLFTTALVFREVESGRVALDDHVNSHVDARAQVRDADGAPVPVTLRHLLTHTSGLPVSWKGLEYGNPLFRLMVNGRQPPRSLADVVAGMQTVRPPGGPIVYANGAFSLLGYMVARLHGTSFEDLIATSLLTPLGLGDSSFPLDPHGPGIATPYGHAIKGGAGRTAVDSIRVYPAPAGALLISARDLSTFGRMLLRGGELDGRRILSSETLDGAMRMAVRNHPELDSGWGLGFDVGEFRGRRSAGHSGGLAGVATRIQLLPDDGIGVVVLTNGGDAGLVDRVVTRMFETLLGLEPERVPGSPQGMAAGTESRWRDLTKQAVGRYHLVDMMPPGTIAKVFGLMARPRLSHVAESVLAVDGVASEPLFLYPDGEPGRYRVAGPFGNGLRAVVEARSDGMHLWASIVHMHRPM